MYRSLRSVANDGDVESVEVVEGVGHYLSGFLGGGVWGKRFVHELPYRDFQYLLVEVSKDVEVKVQKNAVSAVFPKGTLKQL